MRRLLCCCLVVTALCWAQTLGCRLDKPESLKPCVQNILNQNRPALKAKFDPLRLRDASGGSWKKRWQLTNIVVKGASGLRIRELYVRPTGGSKVFIRFAVFWPHLQANMNGRIKLCKKLLRKRRCVVIRGRPQIRVKSAYASLSTTWRIALKGDGLIIIPSGTAISIRLRKIRVKPRLRGVAGVIYRLFGPAKRITNLIVRNQWSKQRPKLEQKLARKIEGFVNKLIGPALTKVLRGKARTYPSK